jgi:hypothetical protein
VSAKKRNLDAAKATKNAEFYTQWADIEREMNAYMEYDPGRVPRQGHPAAVRRPRVEHFVHSPHQ